MWSRLLELIPVVAEPLLRGFSAYQLNQLTLPGPFWFGLAALVLASCCFCAGCCIGLASGELVRSPSLWRWTRRAVRALLQAAGLVRGHAAAQVRVA